MINLRVGLTLIGLGLVPVHKGVVRLSNSDFWIYTTNGFIGLDLIRH